MKKEIIVTISWDDGQKLDLKFANLLKNTDLREPFIFPRRTENGIRGNYCQMRRFINSVEILRLVVIL